MCRCWSLVTTAPSPRGLFVELLPWLGALVIVVGLGGVAIYLLRRALDAGSASGAEGFTLQDLRELCAAGELTDEEFERAKASMIGRVTAETPSAEDDDEKPAGAADGPSVR